MLSVVVYGRNDAHGYNLHKRTAIGLNAIAEVLTAPDDEIVFVDYNTPNDFPTIIEAIRDTLTERCLGRLRVLRVRPVQHERWRPLTPYPVLEAVARNVGARRSNPANRWILSTNPDMVFVPRDPRRSLTDIAGEAPDGFHQLPRFELPETLWETFDRRNPADTIAQLRRWGPRLHLNELVNTGPVSRFDGIGDFQLMLRRSFFAVHGCDERMVFGSLVDDNLCRRMSRLHGGTGSLLDHIFGFHCGHGRQATRLHADDTRMNDPIRFVETVTDPALPDQADHWGLAGEEVEEIRVRQPPGSRYVSVLESVLPGLETGYGEAWNDAAVRFRLKTEPEHALPYLLNHLVNLPPGSVVGYVGGDRRQFALFRDAWRQWAHGCLLVADGMPSIPTGLDGPREQAVGLERLAAEADVLVIDFGLDADLLPVQEPDIGFDHLCSEARRLLGRLKAAFLELCTLERQRQRRGGQPRKVLAVNAINSHAGLLVESHLGFVRIPYSCRVQHGYVRPDGPGIVLPYGETALGPFLGEALRRPLPVDRYEVAIVEGDLARLRADDLESVDARTYSAPLLAALDWPGLDLDGARREAIRAAARRRRPSAAFRPRLAPPVAGATRPPGPPAPCKLAGAQDWDDPDWYAIAHQFTIEGLSYRAPTTNYFKRSRGVWERVHLLSGLHRTRGIGRQDRCAVVSRARDGLPMFLADRVACVDAITTDPGAAAPAHWLGKRRLFHPDRLRVLAAGERAAVEAAPKWDAVLFTQGVLAATGDDDLVEWLAWAETRLDVGGVLGFSVEVGLTDAPGASLVSPPVADALVAALARDTGLRPVGAFDWHIDDATLDRLAEDGGPDMAKPHLVVLTGPVLHTCGVWILRKETDTVTGAWTDVANALPRVRRAAAVSCNR